MEEEELFIGFIGQDKEEAAMAISVDVVEEQSVDRGAGHAP